MSPINLAAKPWEGSPRCLVPVETEAEAEAKASPGAHGEVLLVSQALDTWEKLHLFLVPLAGSSGATGDVQVVLSPTS